MIGDMTLSGLANALKRAEAEIERLREQNIALSANACVHPRGIGRGAVGEPICPLKPVLQEVCSMLVQGEDE